MAEDSTALTDVVDELKDASQGKDTVEVGQLIDALDQRLSLIHISEPTRPY